MHLSLALDAELIRHRVPDALGGAPVDLSDVVVVVILAHRLELGAQPERPPTEAGAPIAAPLRRAREAPRAGQVREHPDLGVLAHAPDPAPGAKRPVDAGCGCRQGVCSPPNRHNGRRERPHRLPRLDAQLGSLRLAHRRPEVAERLQHERGADAAGDRLGDGALDVRRASCDEAIDHRHDENRQRREQRELPRHDQRAESDDRERDRRARPWGHLGTGIVRSTDSIASSGRKRSSSASGWRMIR